MVTPRKTPIIKIRPKPKKPEPKIIKKRKDFYDFTNLKQVLAFFKGIQPKDIKIERNYPTGFMAKVPESDTAFSKRMAKYKKELKEWEKWYKDNQDKVLQEIQRQQDVIEAKKQAEMEKLNAMIGKAFADDLPIGKK